MLWDSFLLAIQFYGLVTQLVKLRDMYEINKYGAKSAESSGKLTLGEREAQKKVISYNKEAEKNQKIIEEYNEHVAASEDALEKARENDSQRSILEAWFQYPEENRVKDGLKVLNCQSKKKYDEIYKLLKAHRDAMTKNNMREIEVNINTLTIASYDGSEYLQEVPTSIFSKFLQQFKSAKSEEYVMWHMQITRDFLPLILGARMCEGVFSQAVSELSDPITDTDYKTPNQKVLDVFKMGLIEGTKEFCKYEGAVMLANDTEWKTNGEKFIYQILPNEINDMSEDDKKIAAVHVGGLFHNIALVPAVLYDNVISNIPDIKWSFLNETKPSSPRLKMKTLRDGIEMKLKPEIETPQPELRRSKRLENQREASKNSASSAAKKTLPTGTSRKHKPNKNANRKI